jgi:hypothetical protein
MAIAASQVYHTKGVYWIKRTKLFLCEFVKKSLGIVVKHTSPA